MGNCQYLIILHGWQSSKEKWSRVKENLEKSGVEVIVPDLPGFKEETELTKPWNLDDYLAWVEDFIERQKNLGRVTEPFFLLGHSFGGRVALKFALKHPQKMKGLILVSAAGIRDRSKLLSKLGLLLKRFSFLPGYPFFRGSYYRFIIRKTDYLNAKGAMKETFKKVIEEDLTLILSSVRAKTLILWGEKDKVTPLSNAHLMKEKIGGSELEILEGLAHTPHLENPEILAKKIIGFVKRT